MKVSLASFFLQWARIKGWSVPPIHIEACHWLEHCGQHAVLRCFRGFGKSTILAVYNAWRYSQDPTYRILHQGADDQMAYKTSRDTQHVLRNHPWTKGLLPSRPGPTEQWWVAGSNDERNASMFAKGITSTTTSSRADECQNDDVEVPKNIQNPEAREKMRMRLGEQIHIMVPDARHLFIGTPHTHDSLYDEQERLGADCLTIRMFEREHRIEQASDTTYQIPFEPEIVFFGIGAEVRLLERGIDWVFKGGRIEFKQLPGGLIDFYAGSAWPERFDASEMLRRRRKTRTINEWDSQYQLHSKPITEVRLDPERMKAYDVEPRLIVSNGGVGMWLGKARIVGAACRWDPAGGKLRSDVSAAAVVLQDDRGRRYWHRAIALTGQVAEFDESGERIIGGQVLQLAQLVMALHLPRITVETNGIGTFAPAVLRATLKQHCKWAVGVCEEQSTTKKNRRILEALEPLLTSGMLWAHTSVINGPAKPQMRDWNPAIDQQPDDYIDAAAGAVTETPERITGPAGLNWPAERPQDWRPSAGVHEVEVEM